MSILLSVIIWKTLSGITLGTNKAYLVKNRLRPILEAHGVENINGCNNKDSKW